MKMSKEVDVSKLVIVNIGGYDYAVHVDNAIGVMKGLADAINIDNEYISGSGYKYYKSDKKPDVSIKLMAESQYLEAMINGYRPKKESPF
jgi:hypothetical protein